MKYAILKATFFSPRFIDFFFSISYTLITSICQC
uniref:Uncharacterized protein n=1 Tax=Siphoviridae sp. ctNU74 TaxID=2825471 RepID=A0A8S5NZ47_9CAUD|nr:MAG TPA: hypothetical protein [Siphoviridae sp. ctNU74]